MVPHLVTALNGPINELEARVLESMPATEPAAPPASGASVQLSATREATVGGTVSVTLANRSALRVSGELVYDGQALQAASPGSAGPGSGRTAFQLAPRGDAVVVLRVLPTAAGQTLAVQVTGLTATDAQGQDSALRLDGEAVIRVPASALPAAATPSVDAPRP